MGERERLARFFCAERDAYEQAVFQAPDKDVALKAVCQAIMWACALDEWCQDHSGVPTYRERLAGDEDGRHVLGLRYARDCGLHRAGEMLDLVGGARLPAPLTAPLWEFEWKSVSELPPLPPALKERPGEQRKLAAYENHLQGKPARFTLAHAHRFLVERGAKLG